MGDLEWASSPDRPTASVGIGSAAPLPKPELTKVKPAADDVEHAIDFPCSDCGAPLAHAPDQEAAVYVQVPVVGASRVGTRDREAIGAVRLQHDLVSPRILIRSDHGFP